MGLAGAGGVLLTRELGLTASQLLALAHKAAGVVVLHAGGVLVLLLGPGRAPAGRAQAGARRVSALLSAAGVWVAVGLGTWSGYPRYVASPIGAGVGSARAWLLAHEPVWDGLMTLKVLTGWLAALVLTAVAAVVARHGALLGQDAGLLRLVRLLLAVGLGAAVAAAVIGVGLNAATPDQGVR